MNVKTNSIYRINFFNILFISYFSIFIFTFDKFYLNISVFGALLNITLNLILIPIYSLVGAAIATIITEALMLILAHLKIKFSLNKPSFG